METLYKISFRLTSKAAVVAPLTIPEHDVHLYSAGLIILQQENHPDFVLYDGNLYCAIDEMPYKLKQALNGELELNSTVYSKIHQCIGYKYNEYIGKRLQDESNTEGELFYIYDLWGTGTSHSMTYLYTIDGKIFLEISTYYYWSPYYTPRPGEIYISHEEYMKTYKPVAIFEIPRKTAQQWLQQAEQLVQAMYTTSAMHKNSA